MEFYFFEKIRILIMLLVVVGVGSIILFLSKRNEKYLKITILSSFSGLSLFAVNLILLSKGFLISSDLLIRDEYYRRVLEDIELILDLLNTEILLLVLLVSTLFVSIIFLLKNSKSNKVFVEDLKVKE